MTREEQPPEMVEIQITDTGTGMSAEKLEHCFDEYWSDKQGGTGLGLATISGLTMLMRDNKDRLAFAKLGKS